MVGLEMDAPLAVTNLVSLAMLPGALLSFAAGLLLGGFHFTSLAWTTQLYANGRIRRAIALHATRLAIIAAFLFGLARMGAVYLIAGALGLLISRAIIVRRWKRMI
ncbi:MAG: ATP synthase subunit I [Novosphingobium sp.]